MDRQVARYQRDDQEFGRAIGFFDATYALALTLLVTTLDIPDPSSAWEGLGALWDAVGPQFLAFGISFAVIALYWLAHHRLVRTLAAVDQLMIVANLVLIASIVVIPFSTNSVGDPGIEDLPLPTAFLAVNIAVASGLHTLVYVLAYRRELFLVRPSAPRGSRSDRYRSVAGGDRPRLRAGRVPGLACHCAAVLAVDHPDSSGRAPLGG
jgi:uncharacterized membrane protein